MFNTLGCSHSGLFGKRQGRREKIVVDEPRKTDKMQCAES